MTSPVTIERSGGVVLITFCDSKNRNGLTTSNIPVLQQAVVEAADDPSALFLVLASAHRNFCIGGSGEFLRETMDSSFDERVRRIRAVQDVVYSIAACPLFTVAVVDGLAAGAGVDMVLASDRVYAGPNARVGLLYSKMGLVPDCGTMFLERHMSANCAFEAIARSPLWRRDDLVRLGIAEAQKDGLATADDWAAFLRRLYRFEGEAFRVTKALATCHLLTALEKEFPTIANAQARCLEAPETRERLLRMIEIQKAS